MTSSVDIFITQFLGNVKEQTMPKTVCGQKRLNLSLAFTFTLTQSSSFGKKKLLVQSLEFYCSGLMELNLKVFLDAKLIDSGINLKNRPFFIFSPDLIF